MAVAIGSTTCPSFFNMLTLLFFSLETHSSGPNWQRGRVKLGHVVGPLGRCSPSALRFRGDMIFFRFYRRLEREVGQLLPNDSPVINGGASESTCQSTAESAR